MKPDYWGARADYEWDQIQEARRLAHLDGECKAPCDWCEDERKKQDKENENK